MRVFGVAAITLFAAAARAASPLEPWVPAPLLRPAPLSLALWQWLALPLLLALALLLAVVATRLTRAALRRLVGRTKIRWDDALLHRSKGPLWLLFTALFASWLVPVLALPESFEDTAKRVLGASTSVGLFWGLFRAADIVAAALAGTAWATESAASRTLIPIGKRISRVIIAAIAVGTALGLLGVPVASIIAGLGIGGLAVALAAQKTFENLLGAFSIGVGQPFREGDFVKVDDFVGTIERVGLRSTQIRTLDRTVITLPNGQLAEKRIESFAARDRILLNAVLGLVYSTTEPQMRAVLQGLERVLRAHPKIWPDAVIVRFNGFGPSSLDVEVMAWLQTTDFDEFCAIRTEVNMQFLAVVAAAGSAFAFPTQTVHVESLPRESGLPAA